MKGKTLDALLQELSRVATEVKQRLAAEEKRIEATRRVMAKTLGHLGIGQSSNGHAATPRRKARKLNTWDTHNEISRAVQDLRHAKERKAPKQETAKIERHLQRLRARLQREKKARAKTA